MEKNLYNLIFWTIICATIFGFTEYFTHYTYNPFERNVLTILGFIGLAILNKSN